MDGGAPPKVNEWAERILCMSFFLYSAWCITQDAWALVSLAGVFGLATGHGQYFLNRSIQAIEPEKTDFLVRLVFGKDPRTNDIYAYVRGDAWYKYGVTVKDDIRIDMQEYGMTKLYWRCVAGMFVTGALVGLPAAILAIVYGEYIAAIPLALTGAAKAGGYMIGYWLEKKKVLNKVTGWRVASFQIGLYLDHHTAVGEYLNGFFRTGLALIAKG